MDYYTRQESDATHAEIRGAVTTEIQALQNVMKTQIEGLATKEDIQTIQDSQRETLDFMKSINYGVGIFKVSSHIIVVIGSFIASIVAIFAFVKFAFGAFLVHLLSK